jgi:2-oxoglutarate dehydrogenase complex dehydrogenase (E1) component-like enzyme
LSQQSKPDLSQVIAEEFGANATYVEGLLERFRSNPDLVDDSWRSYFTELIGDGNGIKTVAAVTAAAPAPAPEPKPAPVPTFPTVPVEPIPEPEPVPEPSPEQTSDL